MEPWEIVLVSAGLVAFCVCICLIGTCCRSKSQIEDRSYSQPTSDNMIYTSSSNETASVVVDNEQTTNNDGLSSESIINSGGKGSDEGRDSGGRNGSDRARVSVVVCDTVAYHNGSGDKDDKRALANHYFSQMNAYLKKNGNR